jgi:hypothetical protein
MTTRITVPPDARPPALFRAIRTAPQEAVIVVPSAAIRTLADRAARTLGRGDVTFEVAEPEGEAAS